MFKNGFVEKIDVDRLSVLNNNLAYRTRKCDTLISAKPEPAEISNGHDHWQYALHLTDKISDVNTR
jgi:tRNA(Ile2) C34 agmatinyltransferase TiaS